MIIMGIDPGSVSGAYALLFDDGIVVDDLPVVDRMLDPAHFSRIVQTAQPDAVILERVSAMPKQGVTSSFRFGMAFGMLQGIVAGAGRPLHLVTPQKWKSHFCLGGGTSEAKEKSRALAIQLYPNVSGLHLKKHHGRAEALLLARYYQDTLNR